jgi:hypothetical protein
MLCKPYCLRCTLTVCLECTNGYMFLLGQCSNDCGVGMFRQNRACSNCVASCRFCVDGSTCLEFGTSTQTTTSDSCPQGFYKEDYKVGSTSRCLACPSLCSSCLPSSTGGQCVTCASGALLSQGSCQAGCPAGYYTQFNYCDPCHPSCATCFGMDASNCETCAPGMLLQNSRCVSQCQPGFYFTGAFCEMCSTACKTCRGPSSEQCISCYLGRYLLGSACRQTCPSYFYSLET